MRVTVLVLALVAVGVLPATDPYCPAYPREQRELDRGHADLERAAQAFASRGSKAPVHLAIIRANFIDDFILGKMAADGVNPAPLTTDPEFLRRVMLDLTGRIPTPDEVTQFVTNPDTGKRIRLIDSLIGSESYIDRFTNFYGDHFQVTSGYYNYIGIPGRNAFYNYLRDFVTRDRSYREVAAELISGEGDSHESGPLNFLVRGWQQGDPIQDTYDVLTDRVTLKFLGVKTECISCHDGRGHLEPINLYLSVRKREQFWRQSAFFSRMSITFRSIDAFAQQVRALIEERDTGAYHTATLGGPRPPRTGGPYEPTYLFSGEQPKTEEWRKELARILTADRQFARAAVNYLWAHFFTVGIVDPPDAWDLRRIDPLNPPPAPWALQPSHPELLEALANEFIRSNYSVRTIIRLMVESKAYQLSSRYSGQWRPEYDRYFAKHTPRRLSAEEIFDAVAAATATEIPMFVEGFDQPLWRAMQLPDPTEPRMDGGIRNFLFQFGRGDWWNNVRSSKPNVLQVLYLMNDYMVNFRTFGNQQGLSTTRVAQLMEMPMADRAAIALMFRATLGRDPTDDEIAVAERNRKPQREQWLSDLQWALLNKLDFIFNY
ncbi:MAG: DUF1553 domain-containing protein [Acidobacteria bacterium]|nr:DUF1553 domain-containing protein [Acidobacteriota bacterium]